MNSANVPGFFAYRQNRELDFFPTGRLRWLLIFVIVWIFCVEQLERLKIGSVLPYIFEEFGVGLQDWGNLGMMGAVAGSNSGYAQMPAAEDPPNLDPPDASDYLSKKV